MEKYQEEIKLINAFLRINQYDVSYINERYDNREYEWKLPTYNLKYHTNFNNQEMREVLKSLMKLSSGAIKKVDTSELKNLAKDGTRFIILKFKMVDLHKLKKILQGRDLVKIKKIELKRDTKALIINDGSTTILHYLKTKSKNPLSGYKIVDILWNYRQEIKNNKIIKEGEWKSLDNLILINEIPKTRGAIEKKIQRMNKKFKDNFLPIEIKHRPQSINYMIEVIKS